MKRRTFPGATRGTSHFKFVLGSAGVDSVGVVERVNRLTIGLGSAAAKTALLKAGVHFLRGVFKSHFFTSAWSKALLIEV